MRATIATVVPVLLLAACPAVSQTRALPHQTSAFWAFTGPWDVQSDASLRQHGGKLDAVVTGWIALDSTSGRPLLPPAYADTIRPRKGTVRRMGIVTSWHGDRFHPASIRALARDRVSLAQAAGAIARYARAMDYRGLVLDFEMLEARDLDAQVRVMKAISDSARARGVTTIAAAIPATDTAAYPARPLLAVVDALIPMLYDQHWAGGDAGPISSPDWVRASLALRIAEAGPDRIIVGLPTYGYRWRKGKPTEHVSFAEAKRIATRTRVVMRRDKTTGTLRAQRAGEWDMWVTDASLLRTLVRQSQEAGVRRFALWRLGQEDPAIWQSLVR